MKEYTKKELLESKQQLNEDFWENALLAAGFVPVVGEVFDIVSIIRYAWKGEYLSAGLMLFALVPGIGSPIVVPIVKVLQKFGITKFGAKEAAKLSAAAAKNPMIKKTISGISVHLKNPAIQKTIEKVSSIHAGAGKALQRSVDDVSNMVQTIAKPKNIIQSIAAAGGKVGAGTKKFFQDERLASYVAKKGMEPKNWLSKWYHVVYKGRLDRKNLIKKFIMSNNLLATLGIPSINDLERMLDTPEGLEKLANNPAFSSIVNQTTSPEDLAAIEGAKAAAKQQGGESGGGGLMGAIIGLGTLKSLAKTLLR